MIELNFKNFENHLPKELIDLDDSTKAKLRDKAVVQFLRKIAQLSRFVKTSIPGGAKPIFGSKKSRQKDVLLYGSYQNPSKTPSLYTSLPTTNRTAFEDGKAHAIHKKDGSWITVKTHSDTRDTLYPVQSWVRIEPDYINGNSNYYYYKNPKNGFIFGYDKTKKKSLYVETNFTGIEVFLKKFSEEDLSMLAFEAWSEVLDNYGE